MELLWAIQGSNNPNDGINRYNVEKFKKLDILTAFSRVPGWMWNPRRESDEGSTYGSTKSSKDWVKEGKNDKERGDWGRKNLGLRSEMRGKSGFVEEKRHCSGDGMREGRRGKKCGEVKTWKEMLIYVTLPMPSFGWWHQRCFNMSLVQPTQLPT